MSEPEIEMTGRVILYCILGAHPLLLAWYCSWGRVSVLIVLFIGRIAALHLPLLITVERLP